MNSEHEYDDVYNDAIYPFQRNDDLLSLLSSVAKGEITPVEAREKINSAEHDALAMLKRYVRLEVRVMDVFDRTEDGDLKFCIPACDRLWINKTFHLWSKDHEDNDDDSPYSTEFDVDMYIDDEDAQFIYHGAERLWERGLIGSKPKDVHVWVKLTASINPPFEDE